jgi:uncharacterized protein (DUF2267 family)
MTTGIATVDETLQHTLSWVDEVCVEMEDPHRAHGWSAFRAVLQRLRDLMGNDEAAHLAAQLPLLLRGLFYEGYDPSPRPDVERDGGVFLRAIERGLGTDRIDPERAVRAVFEVLGRRLGGEAAQVRRRLSAPIRSLWPTQPVDAPRRRSSARATLNAPRARPRSRG